MVSGVEEILNYTESDLHDIGIKNSAHRARMISSLVVLRDKSLKRGTYQYLIYFSVLQVSQVNVN